MRPVSSDPDPLATLLAAAAAGEFPSPDGSVSVVQLPPGSPVSAAILGFTSHHVVVTTVEPSALHARLELAAGVGAPLAPEFVAWLATACGGVPGTLDVVLAAPALPLGGSLDDTVAVRPVPPDLANPRVRRAAAFRTQIRTWVTWDDDAVLVVGRGLAGRWEAALEVLPGARGRGIGRGLLAAARRVVPAGEFVFAQVAPGNAASLRAALAAGYVPIGAEILFGPPGAD